MPFLAVIAVVGMAISAYTVVTGLQEGNKGKALMGVLGLVTGGMGVTAAAAPAVAAAPAAAPLTSGLSGMAAAPAMSAAASPVSTIASGAPALTNMAAAPSALAGASSPVAAAAAPVGAASGMQSLKGPVSGMQSLKGPVSDMNMGTDLKSAFQSGMDFVKENPELIKAGGSLVQGAMNQSTAQDNLRAQREYNDQLRADDEAERKRRSYVPAPTVYHRRDR